VSERSQVLCVFLECFVICVQAEAASSFSGVVTVFCALDTTRAVSERIGQP
jgi:hypothetical protein